MASGTIKNNGVVTKDFGNPAISYSTGTIGTFGGSASLNVELSGYTPIAVSLKNVGHAGSYSPAVVLSDNTVYFIAYRAIASAYTVQANDILCTVAYKKT